jgi:hypothetical protein
VATEELDVAPDFGDVAAKASGNSQPEASLLDALAEQRSDIADFKEVDIPIPGYERSGISLLAKYRLLDGEEVASIGRKIAREFNKRQQYERNLYASVDLMISACTAILYEMDGKKDQLTFNDEPITGYTASLAEALKYEAPNTRQIVFGVFGNNVVALQSHSVLLGRWMSNTSVDVMNELLEGNF